MAHLALLLVAPRAARVKKVFGVSGTLQEASEASLGVIPQRILQKHPD